MIIITLVSLTVAAIMSGIAWRVVRDERRRSEARVAALAAEIQSDFALRTPDVPRTTESAARTTDLFAAPHAASSSAPRFAAVVALGVFVVGTAAALVVVLSGASRERPNTAAPAAPASTRSSNTSEVPAQPGLRPMPLELAALGHERDGNRFTVRGVVRNPVSSAKVDGLTAVVFLLNRDGGFMASGRAAVASPTLAPGNETPFVVTIPEAADVGRYRVSFRTADRVVPHVDRRDRGPQADFP